MTAEITPLIVYLQKDDFKQIDPVRRSSRQKKLTKMEGFLVRVHSE